MVTYTPIMQELPLDEGAEMTGYIGVVATTQIRFRISAGSIVQRLASPGIWSVEDSSPKEYLDELFAEERETLLEMLQEMGAEEES